MKLSTGSPRLRAETLELHAALLLHRQEESIMSSTPDSFERPQNPTQFGGDVSYSSSSDEDSSLRVQLGEHLDERTRDEITGEELIRERLDQTIGDSLQSLERTAHSVIEYVKKNPLPVIAAVGGFAAVLAALSRRRRW
jgi:hypothetical protein